MESQRAGQVEPRCREKAQEGESRPKRPPLTNNAGWIPSDSEVLRIEGTFSKRISCRGFGGNRQGMSTPTRSVRSASKRKSDKPFFAQMRKKGFVRVWRLFTSRKSRLRPPRACAR
jgi:hypothetical protein